MAGGQKGPRFADATDLERWADRRDAQADLPRLVRRLIRHENDQVQRCEMPGGDSVGKHGFDGIVESTRATSFVPEGLSIWEMGVSADPRKKANEDYLARTRNSLGVEKSEATFVFVTPRRWDEKKDWETTKRKEGKWRDVRVLDANDIEQALEECPAVNVFLSELLDMPALGVVTIEDWWRRYSGTFDPTLTPAVVLAGRDDIAASLLRRLARDVGRTYIRAASIDDGLAFAACTMLALGGNESEPMLSRSLLVHDELTLRRLDRTSSLLVLLPYDAGLHRDARLVQNHHVVFIVTDGDADIDLPPLDHLAVESPLRDAGVPHDVLWRYVRAANKSLVALQRVANKFGDVAPDEWATDLEASAVRRAWLAGAWNRRRSGDVDALTALTGVTSETLEEALGGIVRAPDPLFTRVGSTWAVASPGDSWRVARAFLTEQDLEALERTVQVVLGAVDPRLELPAAERWRAAVFSKVRVHSTDLRRGLARSVALLGAMGDEVRLSGGRSGHDWAERIAANTFARANDDVTAQLWASLDDVLPLLAEGAPDVFLRAVDEGTAGDAPLLRKLFQDDKEQGWNVSSPHTGLLWGLECVAWSPMYLGLATELLARLAELDPGGRLSNRPDRSLADVFRPWKPQTAAPPDARLLTVDALLRRHDSVAWKLLMTMLPEHQAIGMDTHKPEFRDWAKDADRPVAVAEYREVVEAAGARVIAAASREPIRWSIVFEGFDRLPAKARDAAVEAVSDEAVQSMSVDSRSELWHAIDQFTRKHRRFADAPWAVSQEWLERLEAVAAEFRPPAPDKSWRWLFDDWHPDLPREPENFDSYQAALDSARANAMRQIVEHGGVDAVVGLAVEVQLPWAVGNALARVAPAVHDRLVVNYFDHQDARLVQFADGYTRVRFGNDLDKVRPLLNDLTGRPLVQARLLQTVSDVERAWELATQLGAEVDAAYWAEFVPYGLGSDFQDAGRAARKLIQHNRVAMAIDALSLYVRREGSGISTDLVAEALSIFGSKPDPEAARVSEHDLSNLLDFLRTHGADEDVVASFEWKFLPLLGYEPRVPSLQNLLARDPGSFVQLVTYAFKPNSASEGSAQDLPEGQASNAYRLLREWRVVPGTRPDGTIDADALRSWLTEATRRLNEADRLEVGELHIGEVFAYAPTDADGTFPSGPVRDVLEAAPTDRYARGFAIRLHNTRGVTSRSVTEGGRQEYELAEAYETKATAIEATHPRTAAVLRRVAEDYRNEGRRNDEEAKRFMEGLDR